MSRFNLSGFFLPWLAATAIVLTVCGLLYVREAQQVEANNLDRESRRMEIYSGLYRNDVANIISDLRVLSSGDSFVDYLQDGKPTDLARAANRAVFFSKDNLDYDQVRYIDENGQEIFRVDHDGAMIPPANLQNKADRPYFQKTNTLTAGQVFLSTIDLNVEQGQVEKPLKPMLRVALPVFDPTGRRRGIYIINYLVGNAFERLRQFVPRYAQRLRILNSQGYWLAGGKPEQEWGFQLGTHEGASMAKTDPELWSEVSKQPGGQMPYEGGYFTWNKAFPAQFGEGKPVTIVNEDEYVVLGSELNADEWSALLARLRQTFVVVALLLVVLTTFMTWFFQARRRAQMERDRFFDLTRDMLCVAGFDGRFRRVNPAWKTALGYNEDEMEGQPFLNFVHPQDRSKTQEQTATLARGGEVISFENRYRCKDGSYRWLLWSARTLPEEQLIYGSARDMTERKQIEEKLREAEERSRLMVESTKDYAIFMLGPDGKVVNWNAGAERIKGFKADEIIGRHFSIFYPEDKAREGFPNQELIEAAARGRYEDEGWRVRRDGSHFWANVVINAMRNSAGELIGFVKVSRDVTERRRAEQALRSSEMRSRSIIESAYDAFISTDIDGRIKDWNLQAESMFGWPRSEAIGRYLHETIIPERFREGHLRGLAHYRASGEGPVLNKTVELVGLRHNGEEFPAELVIWPLKINEETSFNAFIRDITLRKQSVERIARLNEDLSDRAELLEAANKELESFSYSVSHDLRAPLRHVHGFVELLQKNPSLAKDESAQRQMNVIARAAKEMGLLIDDLLAFSRTGRAEMNPVQIDLNEMVEQAIGGFEMEAKGRKVVWDVKPLPKIAGDPGLLRLVWVNLLGNALKYTRPREEARIEVDQIPPDRPGEVTVFVRDNGVGFDMQYASKLFGVFQRLHRAEDFEGTGIGLANVQRIIHRHGGRVWAESKLNEGATFYLSLPIKAVQPT